MKTHSKFFSLILVSFFTISVEALVLPTRVNVIGFTCDATDFQQGNGELFNLAFELEPLKGIANATSIEGDVDKEIEVINDVNTQSTVLISNVKGASDNKIEVVEFKTASLFNELRFSARLGKGSLAEFRSKSMKFKDVLCQAANAVR